MDLNRFKDEDLKMYLKAYMKIKKTEKKIKFSIKKDNNIDNTLLSEYLKIHRFEKIGKTLSNEIKRIFEEDYNISTKEFLKNRNIIMDEEDRKMWFIAAVANLDF